MRALSVSCDSTLQSVYRCISSKVRATVVLFQNANLMALFKHLFLQQDCSLTLPHLNQPVDHLCYVHLCIKLIDFLVQLSNPKQNCYVQGFLGVTQFKASVNKKKQNHHQASQYDFGALHTFFSCSFVMELVGFWQILMNQVRCTKLDVTWNEYFCTSPRKCRKLGTN